MPQARSGTWTPGYIKSLRESRDQSQTDFGLELMDTSPGYAQRRVSELERGEAEPSAAERRTLIRMGAGQV